MIKMVVSSFYNTIIDKEDAIPMSTMLEIDRIKNKNILFTIISNRSVYDLEYYNRDFPFIDYVVGYNGNYVLDTKTKEVIYKNILDEEIIKETIEKYPKNKIYLYGEKETYNKSNYQGHDIYKIEVELSRLDILKLPKGAIPFKLNKKFYLEITSSNNYLGLFKLLEKLNINKQEVLTIIGNDSEKDLIKKIKNTYIIGNSPKSLKLLTKNKTSSNNFKGVEKVLRKFIK